MPQLSPNETMSNSPNTLTIVDPPAVANLMDTGRFNQMMMIAQTMASASLIPEHLLGKKRGGQFEYFTADEIRANCFLIVNQAFRWGMDPFAVMPETYVVGGKLGYQGKLIAALVNSLADLEERLSYTYTGTKGTPDFTVTVSGKIRGEKEPRSVTVRVGDVKTDNTMWTKDPEQKLVYTGATKWARRHCPEIILGILTDEDPEVIELREAKGHVIPSENPFSNQKIDAQPAAEAPKRQKASKPAEQAPAPAESQADPEPENTAPPAEEIPTREQMMADLSAACAKFQVSPSTAAKFYRMYGVVPEGKKIPDLFDEELFQVWKVREIALEKKGEQAA